MRLRYVALAVLLIAVLAGALLLIFAPAAIPEINQTEKTTQSSFSVLKMGRAGNSGYAVFSFQGEGNVTLVGHSSKPCRKIKILKDPDGIENTKITGFSSSLRNGLEKYGYSIEITEKKVLGDDSIYIIPTGAMPSYVISDITHNISSGMIVYLGRTDLLISEGRIKNENWYGNLTEKQKSRLIVYETTLNSYYDSGNTTLSKDILENGWSKSGSETHSVKGKDITTRSTLMNSGEYLRVIYDLGEVHGLVDSVMLPAEEFVLFPSPESIFTWEKSDLMITLNDTNGTAYFLIEKNGAQESEKELGRVVEENVFPQKLEFIEPGNYVLKVYDNSGTLASGIVHVKNFSLALTYSQGYEYVFSVLVDGKPLSGAEVSVSIGDSEMKKDFYVSEGTLNVRAQLSEGKNTFNFDLLGTTIRYEVEHSPSGVFDIYIKYGIPGMILVVLVYLGARLGRKSVYRIKFSESSKNIRPEISVSKEELTSTISKIGEDLNLGKAPINSQEFSIALKRYVTHGAEVTEGNIEEILAVLEDRGVLESHLGYYQIAGTGNAKRNSMKRIIREKLIENGIRFKERKDRFITRDYEVGFIDSDFSQKGYVVVDNESEKTSIMNSLDEKEKSKLMIKQSNGMIVFIPIKKLGEYL